MKSEEQIRKEAQAEQLYPFITGSGWENDTLRKSYSDFNNSQAAKRQEHVAAISQQQVYIAASIEQGEKMEELEKALENISNWLVCAAIASPEDMAQSFPEMLQIAENALSESEQHAGKEQGGKDAIDFAEWLAENTEIVRKPKITLYRYCDNNNEWGNYILADIYTVFKEKYEPQSQIEGGKAEVEKIAGDAWDAAVNSRIILNDEQWKVAKAEYLASLSTTKEAI